jgi:hypothetical protein
MPTLEDATSLAVKVHGGRKDKAGEAYILHPLRVMLRMKTKDEKNRDVGVNGNYLSHPSYSVISSGLAMRSTDAVAISRNRATDGPVYPNLRTVSLVLAWPQFPPFLTPCQILCLFLFLFAPTSPPGFPCQPTVENFLT